MNGKGRITMEDVAREIDIAKGELARTLQRQGVTQLRLKAITSQVEEHLRGLLEDPQTAVLSYSPITINVRTELEQCVELQREVGACVKTLRTLRVPDSEIQHILKGDSNG